MADVPYKRLTRARLRSAFAVAVTSRSSLWLGPDHLLVIDTSGYTETYKRFYFRDIQSFTITLNNRRLVWNWILGALTAFALGGWVLYFLSSPPSALGLPLVAFGIVALFAVPLVLNNLRGPTCTCHLRTAVQTEQLCPLKRLAKAHKIIDRLRPLITEVQGAFSAPGPTAEEQPAANSPVPTAESVEPPADDSAEVPPRMA